MPHRDDGDERHPFRQQPRICQCHGKEPLRRERRPGLHLLRHILTAVGARTCRHSCLANPVSGARSHQQSLSPGSVLMLQARGPQPLWERVSTAHSRIRGMHGRNRPVAAISISLEPPTICSRRVTPTYQAVRASHAKQLASTDSFANPVFGHKMGAPPSSATSGMPRRTKTTVMHMGICATQIYGLAGGASKDGS